LTAVLPLRNTAKRKRPKGGEGGRKGGVAFFVVVWPPVP